MGDAEAGNEKEWKGMPPGIPHASPEGGRLDEGETDGSRVRPMLEPVGGRVRGEVVCVSAASRGNGTFNRVSAWLEVMGGPAHPQPTEAPGNGPSNGDAEERCSVLSEWIRDATEMLAGDVSSTGSAMEAAQESLAVATEGCRTGGMRGEVGGGGERDGMASTLSPLPGDSQGLSGFREGATAGRWAIRGGEGEVVRAVSARPPVSSDHSPRWSARNASWRRRREGTGAPGVRPLRR